MKKHVLGIAFFASIVVFSALIVGFVSYYSTRTIEEVNVPLPEDSREICFPDSVGEKIRVVQAIATPSERTLVLDFGREKIRHPVQAKIVFMAVDGREAKFVRSEIIDIPARTGIVTYKGDWLKDLRSSDNLYVSVRRASFDAGDPNDLSFSKADSTAILIAKK